MFHVLSTTLRHFHLKHNEKQSEQKFRSCYKRKHQLSYIRIVDFSGMMIRGEFKFSKIDHHFWGKTRPI